MMNLKSKIYLLFLLGIFFYTSCRKADKLNEPMQAAQRGSSIEEKFFNSHRSTDAREKALVSFLQRKNKTDKFVEKTVSQIGYPRWDKCITRKFSKAHGRIENDNDSSTITYVPFLIDSQQHVNASMAILTTPADTSFNYLCDWQYKQKQFSINVSDTSAEALAILFMSMDYQCFGYTYFKLTDENLFPAATALAGQDRGIRLRSVGDSAVGKQGRRSNRNSLLDLYSGDETCIDLYVCGTPGSYCAAGCDYMHCAQPDPQSPDHCYLIASFCSGGGYDPPGGGGNTGNVGNGNNGTGGGGGSGGGSSTPPTCPGNNASRIEVVEGCTPGWVPVPIPPPYVCNYQLTAQDIAIFNQIDAEDNLANQNFNLDCQGTRRSGNIYFNGTKEHWLVQIYYLSINPVGGEREYKIPNAGVTPGYPGYADIVNLENGHIFEIKPNGSINLQPAINEVNNYVTKANTNCSSSLQSGTIWNRGTGFVSTYIPAAWPNTYLHLTSPAPGVIFYQEQTLTTPPPLPVLIPQNILDKVKTLVQRLKNNLQNAQRIIAEFFQENPEVVNFIKAAAIGAGAAIIIATIIEDFATAGVGVADDAASFLLAQRIIRFAMAL